MISNDKLMEYWRVPTVATLLDRGQLRWLGHVARMPEERAQRQLLGGRRLLKGVGIQGRSEASLMGGRLDLLLKKHLTAEAKREFFNGARGGDWMVLAGDREGWRRFVGSVKA